MKQFAICLIVIDILLFNVMEVFSVGVAALLDRPCMVFQKNVRVVHLSVHSIGFIYVFVCWKLSHLRV